jgi:hypothetical protein
MQVVADKSTGGLLVLGSSNWSTTAPPTAFTLSSSGLLTGVSVVPTSSFPVTCSAAGQTYNASVAIVGPHALVNGLARTPAGLGLAGASIIFYTAAGTVVTQGTSGSDGTFSVSVDPTATKFMVDLSATNTPVYNEFSFGAADYSASIPSCRITLPALANNVVVNLNNDVVAFVKTGPPPPPVVCR